MAQELGALTCPKKSMMPMCIEPHRGSPQPHLADIDALLDVGSVR